MLRPRVLLLIAGGTSLSPKEITTERVKSPRDVGPWMRELEELLIVADIEPKFISAGMSAEPQSDLWGTIAQTVERDYRRFDGFVLTNDIDSIHYTAPALASALSGIGKPFVLSASPYDLMRRSVPSRIRSMFDEYRGFGNKDNLLNALHVAVADLGETLLVFGNQIHRAIEVSPSRELNLNYFSSLTGQLVGKVDFGLKLFPPIRRRHTQPARFRTSFDPNFLTLDVHPGVAVQPLLATLEPKPKAVFVKLGELTKLPKELSTALQRIQKAGTPIILFREQGASDGRLPFLRLANLPYHTAYVFAAWALGQTKVIPKVRQLLEERVADLTRKGRR